MKNILILSYYFPPTGGAGVQRIVKFSKYLLHLGYNPTIVCGTGPNSTFPVDQSLLEDAGTAETIPIRYRSLEKKCEHILRSPFGRFCNLYFSMWKHVAKRYLEKTIANKQPDVLFVTTSPFPAAQVVASIAQKYSLPWVLDMRDPWALDPISTYPTKLHYLIELRAMKKACHLANAVIMNTPHATHAIRSLFPEAALTKFFCITNGWDKDDFSQSDSFNDSANTPLKIIHTGSFHTKTALRLNKKGRLSNILRYSTCNVNLLSRTPYYLFAATRKLIDEGRLAETDIQFVFAGKTTEDDLQLAETFKLNNMVEYRGYIGHKESVHLLQEADVLFLPLHEPERSSDPLIVPGKTYEYLAARKPILACVPTGDARNILSKSGLGFICPPTDIDLISETIINLVQQFKSTKDINVHPNINYINSFTRDKLAKELIKVLHSAWSDHIGKS